ncbi:MAG: BlaI/MecI/CopY family transcriptional regulator [Verrucomicrobiota bacterium]|jgi:predicted transcriptional regulator
MSTNRRKIELTEGEWAIMRAVWVAEPCAAPTVQESLQSSRNWAHSTVRTLMDRMVAKGLLRSEKIRHMTLYSAAVTRRQAQRGEVLYALKNAFNGALTPMVQCLLETREISADDLAEVERLVRQRRKNSKS